LKSGTWQGKVIHGMIRTLAVNCAPILHCSTYYGKTAAQTPTNEMVMGAVWAVCQFCVLVSQQNHFDLSLNALDDALKQFCQQQGIFRDQTMSKSVKATVDDLLATESDQLGEQKILKTHAAMEALVYGAEKVSTTKHRQFQLRLNSARQALTTWSDADCKKAIE
jgi:hypothetical protein